MAGTVWGGRYGRKAEPGGQGVREGGRSYTTTMVAGRRVPSASHYVLPFLPESFIVMLLAFIIHISDIAGIGLP